MVITILWLKSLIFDVCSSCTDLTIAFLKEKIVIYWCSSMKKSICTDKDELGMEITIFWALGFGLIISMTLLIITCSEYATKGSQWCSGLRHTFIISSLRSHVQSPVLALIFSWLWSCIVLYSTIFIIQWFLFSSTVLHNV
jgi:hypothetical protein